MTKEIITLEKENESIYSLTYYNGVDVGSFERDVDGYFYYWPSSNGGCWNAHVMIYIADLLNDVNKEWDDKVTSDFKNE